jgi:hypothetical protein
MIDEKSQLAINSSSEKTEKTGVCLLWSSRLLLMNPQYPVLLRAIVTPDKLADMNIAGPQAISIVASYPTPQNASLDLPSEPQAIGVLPINPISPPVNRNPTHYHPEWPVGSADSASIPWPLIVTTQQDRPPTVIFSLSFASS